MKTFVHFCATARAGSPGTAGGALAVTVHAEFTTLGWILASRVAVSYVPVVGVVLATLKSTFILRLRKPPEYFMGGCPFPHLGHVTVLPLTVSLQSG